VDVKRVFFYSHAMSPNAYGIFWHDVRGDSLRLRDGEVTAMYQACKQWGYCYRHKSVVTTHLLTLLMLAVFLSRGRAQSLQVSYGSKAIQAIHYSGISLEDTSIHPADSFHIWHMKSTDLHGNVIRSGQYGWGENNNGESWNLNSGTEKYKFVWGSITTQLVQHGDTLDMIVTEYNNANSGIIFCGAEIFPFTLHFPKEPAGFSGSSQFLNTTTSPGVSTVDFGNGLVTSVVPNESVPLYNGWKSMGSQSYSPIMTSTAPDGLPNFLPSRDRPVMPGSSFTYTVSLRFTPPGMVPNATDAYRSFASTYPSQMTWSDKRIIGTAYLASSPSNRGDKTQAGGFLKNPRRYFNDSSVDVTTPAGLASFQKRMLAQAATNVVNAKVLGGQGVIIWDIEGEEYPQNTSYVCSPDKIALVSPEMESVISDKTSAFYGRKLDDAYFQTITATGLKVGVCIRPQMFNLSTSGHASQNFIGGNSAIIANLEKKAMYANRRWGVTIFYVDSTVDQYGGVLDPEIFQQIITDLPNLLFIPEESTPRYYAYSAPFYSFIFRKDIGTQTSVLHYYPKAFGVNLINDVAPALLATHQAQLTAAVAQGDILMGHVDYWQSNNSTLNAIYQQARLASAQRGKE
jgi:hypothetical protein